MYLSARRYFEVLSLLFSWGLNPAESPKFTNSTLENAHLGVFSCVVSAMEFPRCNCLPIKNSKYIFVVDTDSIATQNILDRLVARRLIWHLLIVCVGKPSSFHKQSIDRDVDVPRLSISLCMYMEWGPRSGTTEYIPGKIYDVMLGCVWRKITSSNTKRACYELG